MYIIIFFYNKGGNSFRRFLCNEDLNIVQISPVALVVKTVFRSRSCLTSVVRPGLKRKWTNTVSCSCGHCSWKWQ